MLSALIGELLAHSMLSLLKYEFQDLLLSLLKGKWSNHVAGIVFAGAIGHRIFGHCIFVIIINLG